MELLKSYPWPGNIRELQNVIERSVIVCETETFSVDESWLPENDRPSPRASRSSKCLANQEKEMIETALVETRAECPVPRVRRRNSVFSSTLESKIRSLKIDKHRFKAP